VASTLAPAMGGAFNWLYTNMDVTGRRNGPVLQFLGALGASRKVTRIFGRPAGQGDQNKIGRPDLVGTYRSAEKSSIAKPTLSNR